MAVHIERGLVPTSFGYIHYRAAGQGTPIALLHVNQQSSTLYLEMIEALAPHMRAIATDYPSHGGSDHISYQPSIADYAKSIIEVMDALGVRKFVALGEATGAGVAAELSANHADRVSHVVLLNCPIIVDPPDNFLAPFKGTYRPSDPTGFPALRTIEFMLSTDPDHSPINPTQDWMDRVNRSQMECGRDRWQALTALAYFDMLGTLERVKHPVFMLTSTHFYYRDRIPKILERVRDIETGDLVGARICVGWECAAEIAERTVEFVKRRG